MPPLVAERTALPTGRAAGRMRVLPRALRLRLSRRRQPPRAALRRVLVAHHLLLGDTLMLTPLLAKLRRLHPAADIAMTVPKAFAGCYAARPYGVLALPFDPRDPASVERVLASGPYDLALVPGDNRFAWLALAADARWIVAFAGDRPAYKNWPVDEPRAYPAQPAAWGDMVAGLIDGEAPPPFDPADWTAPAAASFDPPRSRDYAVLHVGASTPLKRWPADRWRAVAELLRKQGVEPVFLAGRGEEGVAAEIDPAARYASYAGRLSLEQVWHLLASARALVAPDTGIAHLGRITGVPTVTLFGPGSAVICGAGEFWRNSPYWAVTVPDFPCRDQRVLFRREIQWVRRCGRSLRECPSPRCMEALGVGMVMAAVDAALQVRARPKAGPATRGP